jgi:hypothetical protein
VLRCVTVYLAFAFGTRRGIGVNGAGPKKKRQERRAKPGIAAFRSPRIAFVVALSLLVQLIAVSYHQALDAPAFPSSDTAAIAADLKATFGDAAALCVQVDDKGAPLAPAGRCDDQCPLCQFSAHVAALIVPDAASLPERLDAACQTIGAAPERGSIPVCLSNRIRARAPPLAV